MTAVVGIDLGGTNLRAALVDEHGRRLSDAFEPVPTGEAPAILDALAGLVDRLQVAAGTKAAAIGLGIGGLVDEAGRMPAGMTNLPMLAERPLVAELGARIGLPVVIENDARAALLGETRFGAARGRRDVLMLTLGTGLGGAFLLDGRVRRGARGMACELALTPVAARDGRGTIALEEVVAPGRIRRNEGMAVENIVARMDQGDAACRARWDELMATLARAIAGWHVALDLELVLLSGGMTRLGDRLVRDLTAAVRRATPPPLDAGPDLALADLGEWSGTLGAAALAQDLAGR